MALLADETPWPQCRTAGQWHDALYRPAHVRRGIALQGHTPGSTTLTTLLVITKTLRWIQTIEGRVAPLFTPFMASSTATLEVVKKLLAANADVERITQQRRP